MGLSTFTHTPKPMGFLSDIFDRPARERPHVLFPVGYPANDCPVPDLERKELGKVMVFIDWIPLAIRRISHPVIKS